MKVTIYISKKDFDAFFRWVKQLEYGILSAPPVDFSHAEYEIRDPLKVSLDSSEYYLITDAKEDLEDIRNTYGNLDFNYESDTQEIHLQRIKECVRRAAREDLEVELVYSALKTMKELPTLTPGEAMIVAEKSMFGNS